MTLFGKIASEEAVIEKMRENLCKDKKFELMTAFLALQDDPDLKSLSYEELSDFLKANKVAH